MKKLFVVLTVILLFVVIGCSSKSDDQNQTTQPTQPTAANADQIGPGGNNASPDANLVVVNFTGTASAQASATAKQASLAARLWAVMKSVVNGNTYSIGATNSEWISQHTSSSSCGADTNTRDANNGYCGFTSVMMGAKYLNVSNLPTLYSDTTTVSDIVNTKFPSDSPNYADYKNNCGGKEGINWDDIPVFANALGIDAQQFQADTSQAETWIKNALGANFPVVARVLYQGYTCSGRKALNVSESDYYNEGASANIQMMDQCYYSDGSEMGHWVMVVEINDSNDSVLVFDPDPLATNTIAGIRRYTKSSFLSVLETNVRSNGHPEMYELCPQSGCPQNCPAFTTTTGSIPLSTNTNYTAENAVPVVNPLIPNSTFTADGLPSCLSMDTEGRITGECSDTGQYIIQIRMINHQAANDTVRYAIQQIMVSVENGSSITEALQFVTPSSLNVATVGNYYLLPLSVTGTAETQTFSLTSGNLPQGLNLQNGQIFGTPTQAGTYSFGITVSTSTSSVSKTFNLIVEPATNVSVPQLVLSGITPSTVVGIDGQQTVVFTGSGFTNGAIVELTDTTNGGTYEKIPVTINSAGTEITISANFTSSPATWSAFVIPLSGNPSGTITFSVVAPVSAAPVISGVSPNILTASTSAQTITITGNNYRTGAVVEITNLATGAIVDLSPSTLSSAQIVASYSFDAATIWSTRIINSDGTSSASMYITVNAPSSTAIPVIPSLVSPGTATGPGTVLSNTTASLSWNSDASASYYKVAVRDLGSGSLVVDTTTNTPSFSVNLLAGEQYRWNAASCNAAGCSSYAAPLYFLIPSSTVSAPTISSISPTSYPSSSSNQAMTINGANFQSGATLTFVPPEGGTIASAASKLTFVNSSQLSYQFNNQNDTGTWSVQVNNPDGQHSGTVSFTVNAVVTASPDLQVLSGVVSPSSVIAGGTVSANWTISNKGTGTANASTTAVRINQSSSSAAGTNLTLISTNSLAANGSQSESANLTAPTTAGTYYVWVIADDYSTSGESTSAAANDIVCIGSFTVN